MGDLNHDLRAIPICANIRYSYPINIYTIQNSDINFVGWSDNSCNKYLIIHDKIVKGFGAKFTAV